MHLIQEDTDDNGNAQDFSKSNIYMALKHLNYHRNVSRTVGLKDADIQQLKYIVPTVKDDSTTTKPSNEEPKTRMLVDGEKIMVKLLREYKHYYFKQNGTALDVEDWLNVTIDDIEAFNNIWDGTSTSVEDAHATKSKSTTSTKPPVSEVDSFKKGIKRDPSLFPTLKNQKQWDKWLIELRAQARAQAVEIVLDTTYTPSTTEDIELFDEKQKYVYAVFTKILQTDKGKSLVRLHSDDYDAQQLFHDLYEHALKSTQASIEASDLLKYITSASLESG